MKTDLILFITTALLLGCMFGASISHAGCEDKEEDEYIWIEVVNV